MLRNRKQVEITVELKSWLMFVPIIPPNLCLAEYSIKLCQLFMRGCMLERVIGV